MHTTSKIIWVLILSVMMVFLNSMAVLAGQPQETSKAEILKTLKIINGTGKGFELDKVFTRAQGTVVIIKLFGMEKAAQESNLKPVFSDVKSNHWAAKPITFAFQKRIVSGTGGNKFSPDRPMTGKEFITLVLRGLGYKETSPEILEFLAVRSGLLKQQETGSLITKKVFNRNNMVLVVYNALKTKSKGRNKTLLQTMVESKVVSREAALSSGLFSEVKTPLVIPVEPKVSGSQDPLDRIEDAIKKALQTNTK